LPYVRSTHLGLNIGYSDEVYERADYAGSWAAERALGSFRGKTDWIEDHYRKSPILREGLENKTLRSMLHNPSDLTALILAPFRDTGYVAGGAKYRLDRDGYTAQNTDQVKLIGNSKSLLLFARIDALNTKEEVEDYLGPPPYVSSDYLSTNIRDGRVRSVSFTEDAERVCMG
jgi:hypothetical protein